METAILSILQISIKIINLSETIKINELKYKNLILKVESIKNEFQNEFDDNYYSCPSINGLIETLKECEKFLTSLNNANLISSKRVKTLDNNLEYWHKKVKNELKEFKRNNKNTNNELLIAKKEVENIWKDL